MGRKRKQWLLRGMFFLSASVCAACAAAYMVFAGILIPNRIFLWEDSLVGCDVSRYQGNIQWEEMERQGLTFAFIKATEGSSHVDPKFEENWEQASRTELLVGAYHFFSFESPGAAQAEHFLKTVGTEGGMLCPAVDVEFYGGYTGENTDPEAVRGELDRFISAVRESCGMSPVIYTTKEAYEIFLDGHFEDCPLWIRSVLTYPRVNREWTFWQYTNRERLSGYDGEERYIDMNVFRGTRRDLEGMRIL